MAKLAIFGTSGFAYETSEVAIACGYGEIVHIAKTQLENDPYFPQRPESEVNQLREDGFVLPSASQAAVFDVRLHRDTVIYRI